jgi:hypothetical protein
MSKETRTLNVVITAASNESLWYAGKVGETFAVYDEPDGNPNFPSYVLKADRDRTRGAMVCTVRIILKADALEVVDGQKG